MGQKKTKVLLLGFEDRGVGASSLLAAEALSRLPGLDVRFIADRTAVESALQRTRLEGIPGITVKTRPRQHLPFAWLRTLLFCLKFQPDVVHDLACSAFRKNLPLWPVLAVRSRLVFSEHAPDCGWSSCYSNRLARDAACRLGRKFIVFGPHSHATLLACGVAARKIFQSRLGHKGFYAETPRAKPPRDPNTVLFFGELREGKGVDWLLPIADLVHARRPTARFVVAGSSASAKYSGPACVRQLQASLDAMRARPYFEVRDEFIRDEDLAGYFWRAGMVLLPYRSANQSGVLLTAMPLECPAVASRVGDLPAVLRHGENGLLCAPNPAALADGVIALLQDPPRAAALAAQARRDAHDFHAWEDLVREYPGNVYSC